MLKKYFIHTYGCQMNLHESEKMAGILESKGYVAADEMKDADLILLNTCAVRDTAESHVVGNLGIVKKLKENKPYLKVIVCGCMTQKKETALNIKKRCPFIDLIIGTHNMYGLGEYLDKIENNEKIVDIPDSEGQITENIPVQRSSGVNAWVNIMYGCNNFCSYCIVPYVKGRERSRGNKEILAEIKTLLEKGYKEITLLGQNVNSYKYEDIDFAALLTEILSIDAKFRLKFMTSHPKDLSESVVKIISQSDNAAKYIHLPLQAGSDRILKLMNRRYTSRDYLEKIAMIRDYIPNAGISSDIIVGFPTETEEDFAQTMELIEKVRFNNLYTFIYSRRRGTVADEMEGQISKEVKTERIQRLINKQFIIGNEIAEECIGKKYSVLVDSYKKGVCSGKTECDKSLFFKSEVDLTGKFTQVTVTQRKNNKLEGQLVDIERG